MSKLPQETRGYIQNMAGGGAVHFQTGGINDVFNMTPDEVKEYAKRKLRFDQLRSTFTPEPVVPSAPAAAAAVAEQAPSFLDRAKTGIKGLASKLTPGARALTLGANLGLYTPELNSNETAELERRRKMGFNVAGAGRGATNPNDPRLVSSPNFAAQTQNSAFNPAVTKPSPYDIEDMEAGQGAEAAAAAAAALQQQAKKEEPAAATPTTPDYASGIEQLLSKREAGMGKQRDIDNYMALLSAGLGMMGGTSPFAAANIGQGAQAGIKTFSDSQARRAAEENAILSGRLGMYKYAGSRSQAEALMQLRKEMAEKSDLRAREIAAATRGEKIREFDIGQEAKASARLADITKNIEAQAEKNIAADVRKNLDKDREKFKQMEIERLTRVNKTIPKLYKQVYGPDADPFEGMTSTGGGMSKERASQFKVER
jgi:hypothetical protein